MSHKACSEKLNIILSRIPLNKFEDYKVATEQYFTTYRTRILKHLGNNKKYYKVLRYYIFGTSDIAYITLTESDKFSQKIFSPIISNENKLPLSYQIISGITQSCKNSSLEDSFNQLGNFNEDDDVFVEGKYKYSIICNLKLNPGYLLGGLLAFFESVEETINQIIKDHFETKTLEKEEEKNYQYIITRTFSWSDINLVLFANDLGKITSAIAKIRRCQFKDLNSKITDTLYHHFLEKENQDKIEGNHIFIETQTYFGVEFDYFRNGKIEESLKTQVECKVKPGHEKILFKNLKANKTICNSIDFDKIRFLYGTTDILLSEKNSSISNNQDIVKIIQEPEFSDHIRKIKTRILVDADINIVDDNRDEEIPFYLDLKDKILRKFEIETDKIITISIKLKKLKISRHLRQKIIKTFQTFNVGITDPVLTISFMDFKRFIENFIEEINNRLDDVENVDKIEQRLEEYIRVYDKALQTRTLNPYLYEEMGEIDIDYQSSVQKYLSIYNSLANLEVENIKEAENIKLKSRIVNAHQTFTISNVISINFNIHHLTSPEFINISLHKEVLNSVIKDKPKDTRKLYNRLRNSLSSKAKKTFNFFDDNYNHHKKMIENIIIDIYRVFLTFGGDLELYYYYSWFFILQSPSNYNSNGLIKEESFQNELKRILLVHYILNKSAIEKFWLPTVELANDWNKHYTELSKVLLEDNCKGVRLNFEDHDEFEGKLDSAIDGFDTIAETFSQEIFGISVINLKDSDNILFKKFKNYQKLFSNIKSDSIYEKYKEFIKKSRTINDTEKYDEKRTSLSLFFKLTSFLYLKKIYQTNTSNGKKIHLLKRNLESGEILNSFIEYYKKHTPSLYLIDSHGGIFFYNEEKQKEYYAMRDDYFNVLMDIHLRIKTIDSLEHINK